MVLVLCEWNSLVTSEFPAQKASNMEKASIWWCHHAHTAADVNQTKLEYSVVSKTSCQLQAFYSTANKLVFGNEYTSASHELSLWFVLCCALVIILPWSWLDIWFETMRWLVLGHVTCINSATETCQPPPANYNLFVSLAFELIKMKSLMTQYASKWKDRD